MATIARVQILAPAVKGALENGPWRPFTFEGMFFGFFFFSAVTERWAWLVRGGHVTGKYRNDKQPQIGLT